jgi:sterol desaturase/sphingolipid hydroxylase (fatty acid hydroxylase superfamily)
MRLEAVVLFKTWIIAGWFASVFVAERLAPAAPPPEGVARLVTNGALWLIVLLISPLIVLPLTAFASGHPIWMRPEIEPAWPLLVADIILLDCWTYWLHRAYHRVPVMWRLHEPHHLDEHLDSSSALRFHAGEVALSALLRMAPIALLAIPFGHVVIFETLLLAGAIFHHSNLRLPGRLERALSWVIVTPSIHWVHHHAIRRDTDSNYSGILSLWDRIFGTRSPTARAPEMKIGVEGLEDRAVFELLLRPFMKRLR